MFANVLLPLLTLIPFADDAGDEIAAAKEANREALLAYDEAVLEAGDRLVRELRRRQGQAQTRGDLKEYETITAQIDAFQDDGKLPDSPAIGPYDKAVERAAKVLERSYLTSITTLTRLGAVEEAREMQEDLKAFRSDGRDVVAKADYRFVDAATAAVFTVEQLTKQRLANGERAFTNRGYKWTNLPDDPPFDHFYQVDGGGRYAIRLEITKPGWLYITISDENRAAVLPALQNDGWQAVPFTFGYSHGDKPKMTVFRQKVEAGPMLIPRLNWSGPIVLEP